MSASHSYELSLQWTGNTGSGTSSYRTYSRELTRSAPSANQSLSARPTRPSAATRSAGIRKNCSWPPVPMPHAVVPAPRRQRRHRRDRLSRHPVGRHERERRRQWRVPRGPAPPSVTVADGGIANTPKPFTTMPRSCASSPARSTSRSIINPSPSSVLAGPLAPGCRGRRRARRGWPCSVSAQR